MVWLMSTMWPPERRMNQHTFLTIVSTSCTMYVYSTPQASSTNCCKCSLSLSFAFIRSSFHLFEQRTETFAGKFNQATLNIIAPQKKKQIKDEIERLKNHHWKWCEKEKIEIDNTSNTYIFVFFSMFRRIHSALQHIQLIRQKNSFCWVFASYAQ